MYIYIHTYTYIYIYINIYTYRGNPGDRLELEDVNVALENLLVSHLSRNNKGDWLTVELPPFMQGLG